MKIAFTGKGGVGKTTLASLFIQTLSSDGKEILAVDCDPDSNLARALGFENADRITPIAHMEDVIQERMGIESGNKSFFKLNPKIDDIPDKFSVSKGNIKLIVMGAVEQGGEGCMCPESAFIKTLLGHLVLKRNEHLVMDMEAGLEHFGRGTASSCDFVLVVVEPSVNSVETAKKIAGFAKDIGIKKIYAIGNKVRSKGDADFMKRELKNIQLIETIEFDKSFLEWGRGSSIPVIPKEITKRFGNIKRILEEDLN
ncbi:MAG: AAA family ATPase [Candidatus Omnitrophica bacterium]|nr:AAA family ATPase [Candidatus Omnitrophota bacterium]